MHLVSCNGKLQTNCREKSCRLIRTCLLVLPLFLSSYFRGLEAMIKGHRGSSCNELIFSHTATIESPGYPLYYPPLLNCVYTIRKYKPEVCQVKIYVNDFQLDNSNQCACDFLCVDSRRYCGRMLRPKQTLTLDFPYWKNKLFLNFHTNWIRWGKGFSLEIHQKTNCDPSPSNRVTTPHPPPFCNALLRHPEGIITSLGYPQKYSNNMDCTYRFVRNGGDTCWLELTFVDFSVQATQDCSGDYLEIGESRFCGEIMNRRVETPFAPGENYIDIKFITDNSATNRGFYLTYKLISCNDISSSTESSLITSPSTRDVTVTPHPPRCNYYLTQRTGNITSSGYPVSYSNNMDCTYTITKLGRDICWLKITFVDFSLQKSDDCTRDYLGINVDNRFCGNVKKQSRGNVSLSYQSEFYQPQVHHR
ncbi:CUB domain-containing protein 2-like [Tachypleus tridentatus]|uniref:CUB domain-containing protein 2-like n=1 Tax=Tachypleus tridentatus TaxID=6853 RepID=UPI003FD03097